MRANSTSGSNGLPTNAVKPARTRSCGASSRVEADSAMIGSRRRRSSGSARMRRAASMPSSTGIRRSISTTSCSPAITRSSASRPSPAASTSTPQPRRHWLST
jgi:hypothetical protein